MHPGGWRHHPDPDRFNNYRNRNAARRRAALQPGRGPDRARSLVRISGGTDRARARGAAAAARDHPAARSACGRPRAAAHGLRRQLERAAG